MDVGVLRLNTHEAERPPVEDRLGEGIEGFEAVLTGMVVREALKPGKEGGLLGKGPGLSVLGGMVEQVLAEQWAAAGGLGLEKALRARLEGAE